MTTEFQQVSADAYKSLDVLYENDTYRVYRAIGGLPVALGNEIAFFDGYAIINKMTGQQDGEGRSYASVVHTAHQWDSLIGQISHVESGLDLPPSAKAN